MILMDQETGDGVVVLDLATYEQMVGGRGGNRGVAERMSDRVQEREYEPEREYDRPQQPRRISASMLSEAEVLAQVGEPITRVVRKRPVGMRQNPAQRDLTSGGLRDTINRDIGEWKNAPKNKLEDEERFYLEPIE